MSEKNQIDRPDSQNMSKLAIQLKSCSKFLTQVDPFAYYQLRRHRGIEERFSETDDFTPENHLLQKQKLAPKPQTPQSIKDEPTKQNEFINIPLNELSKSSKNVSFSLSSQPHLPENQTQQSIGPFDDLVLWMKKAFPQHLLISDYQSPKKQQSSAPLVIIVIDYSKPNNEICLDLSERVTQALIQRGVEVMQIDQNAWPGINQNDYKHLKLIIGEKKLSKIDSKDHQEIISAIPMVHVDWDLCADNESQKALLWKEIKRYLHKST